MPKKKTGGEALKYVIVFGILFAIGIFIVWGMTGRPQWSKPEIALVENGDLVTLNYTGWYSNGSFLEAGTVEFRPGTGQIPMKGVDGGVLGMRLGETRTLNLTPEYAFGEYDDKLRFRQPKVLVLNSTVTFATTPEQFNATFGGMPEEGMIVTSVDLPWKTVEILNFTNTTMTWRLMPPEGHKTAWPLDCLDRNRLNVVANDCYGSATMNLTEGGERIEVKIEPYIGQTVSIGGMTARVLDSGNESIYMLDFNHELAGESLIYQVKLTKLEKGQV